MGLKSNKQEVGMTGPRMSVLDIVEAGIEAVQPQTIMKVVHYLEGKPSANGNLFVNGENVYGGNGRIFVIGGGKAFGSMAQSLENIIGPDKISAGVGNDVVDYPDLGIIKVVRASHPTPDYAGMAGVRWMCALKDEYKISKDDAVIFLVSGGGSSLMPYPVDGVSLQDKVAVTKLLLQCNGIHDTNTVRKHLSLVKGGQLGRYFSPAKVVTLALSDVIGNDRSVIASGPTYPDQSTFVNAKSILQQQRNGRVLWDEAPESVKQYLLRGMDGHAPETPRELPNCTSYHILGENMTALKAMAAKARQLGFKPFVVEQPQVGETRSAAGTIAREILEGKYNGHDILIVGGETVPQLPKEHGVGGRNQQFALASMQALEKYSGYWAVASIGTDGADFTTGAAGAIVDKNSLEWALQNGLRDGIEKALTSHDSNTFLRNLGHSLVITGPTGTNVCDVMVYYLGPPAR